MNRGYPILPLVAPTQVTGNHFTLQRGDVRAFYLGPTHTPADIFVYFPRERVLDAGSILKPHLGNMAEANACAYPKTLLKLERMHLKVQTVIAGHWSAVHGPALIGKYLRMLERYDQTHPDLTGHCPVGARHKCGGLARVFPEKGENGGLSSMRTIARRTRQRSMRLNHGTVNVSVAISSAAQQPLGQQGLHVSTAVGDQVDHDLMAVHPRQEPVRFERYLSILAQTQFAEFLRNGATLRACDKTVCDVQQPPQRAVSVLDGVSVRDVIVKLAKVDFGILGEKNLIRHLAGEAVLWCKGRVRPVLASAL